MRNSMFQIPKNLSLKCVNVTKKINKPARSRTHWEKEKTSVAET